jgi:hypothetical protein
METMPLQTDLFRLPIGKSRKMNYFWKEINGIFG